MMIESLRLYFRQYTEEDLPLLYSMSSDPDIMKYIGKGITWSQDATKERLKRFLEWYQLNEGTGLMLAFHKETDKFIGHAGLIPQRVEGVKELEVGYWIVKDFWRQGYGYEAANEFKRYGLEVLGQNRLVSLIQHPNIGSIKVAEKNGMSYEKEVHYNGQSVRLYSIERK